MLEWGSNLMSFAVTSAIAAIKTLQTSKCPFNEDQWRAVTWLPQKLFSHVGFSSTTNYLLLLLSCADAGSARTWSCTSPKSPWRAAVRMSSCLIRRAYNKKRVTPQPLRRKLKHCKKR